MCPAITKIPILCALLLMPFYCLAEPVTVQDYRGRSVVLEEPARRIVALAPHAVENTYSAGAGDLLVAAVEHSDYPAAARRLPRVGGFNTVSLEAIVASEPDLVIAWATGTNGALIEQLSRLGIPVYADEPRELEDIARSIRDIGRLTGREARSAAAADRFLGGLDALRKRYSGLPLRRVFYQVWNQPLQTVNGEHIISHLLAACGAQNIFADAAPLAPTISLEEVLTRDPDVILASGSGVERPDWLDDWRRFPGLKAVRNEQLLFVPADYLQRHTVRLLEGAQMLCRQIDEAR
ncbi:cobalamin-binding protein [Gilvimarinus sp. F26214L]|uniref:cobalamin-binding protein n=1 Tax=Gilvimarinus sp. DZF01 TaxID=3461371 RepID=UPI004045A1F1